MLFRSVSLLTVISLFSFSGGSARASETMSFDEEPIVRALVMEEARQLAVEVVHLAALGVEGGDGPVLIEAETVLRLAPVEGGVVVRNETTGADLVRGPAIQLRPDAPDGLFSLRDPVTGETPRGAPRYEGVLEVRPAGDGLNAIVILPVEEYLRGVVPAEIGASAPLEAMKAQAVAARSETLSTLIERTYAGPHYDICSDVMCQVFRGTSGRTENTDRAIRETRGIIVAYQGLPLPAYYSANSGGHTEDLVNVWPERDRGIPVWEGVFDGVSPAENPGDLREEENVRRWILSRPNVYSNIDYFPGLPGFTRAGFRWEVTTSAEDLTRFVAEHEDIGRVTAIEPVRRGPSGRIALVRFVGENGAWEVGPELTIRRVWQPGLRSSAFIVEPNGPEERPESFTIRGAGFGHGVGMCQVGAMGRALSGQNYEQILTHYYVDTELVQAYE